MAVKLVRGFRIGEAYELSAELGAGGFGVVWEAVDLRREARVAVKLLNGQADAVARVRFQREAQALAALEHPNCLSVLDAGVLPSGRPYIVTELVVGLRLDQWMNEHDHSRAESLEVASQVCAALAYAHDVGIIHRDLKAQNIIVGHDGSIRVLDFGIAKLVGFEQPDVTKTGEVLGTVGCMSPEQLRGSRDIGPASDMYSFGVLLHTMLAGKPPFVRETPLATCMAHLADPPPRLRGDGAVVELTHALLDKSPERRPSARGALKVLTQGDLGGARSVLEHRLAVSAFALCVTAAIAMFIVVTLDEEPTARPENFTQRRTGLNSLLTDQPQSMTVPAPQVSKSEICGRKSKPGHFRGTVVDANLRSLEWLVYVPESYTGVEPTPVVLTLAQHGTSAEQFFERTGLRREADLHGFVVVSPEPSDGRWDDESDGLRRVMDEVEADYCVDDRRVFAVGFIAGGHEAARLTCKSWIAGAAAASARPEHARPDCDVPKPFMLLSPTKTEHAHVDGGLNCMRNPKISLADHEQMWRSRNNCRGERLPYFEHLGSACTTWDCDSDFVSCHLDGGHNWPGAPLRALGVLSPNCSDGPDTEFPVGSVLWRFFSSINSPE